MLYQRQAGLLLWTIAMEPCYNPIRLPHHLLSSAFCSKHLGNLQNDSFHLKINLLHSMLNVYTYILLQKLNFWKGESPFQTLLSDTLWWTKSKTQILTFASAPCEPDL